MIPLSLEEARLFLKLADDKFRAVDNNRPGFGEDGYEEALAVASEWAGLCDMLRDRIDEATAPAGRNP